MSTLAERIKERMKAKSLTNAELARAAGVKQPTAFNWASGKTQNIKGVPLLLAAAALGVTPTWLATGKGKKFPDADGSTSHHVAEPEAEYRSAPAYDKYTAEAVKIMLALPEKHRPGAVSVLRAHANSLAPPRVGHPVPMAV